jgi:hypothetical protein
MVKVRKHVVNIQSVADAHWEGEKLYLHFDGGCFATLVGKEAELIWSAILTMALDLDTGELGAAVSNVATG